MKEVTFVTAFFNIGRENWKTTNLSRSNDKYLNYFSEWAVNFENNLIVYTNVKDFVNKIEKIREKQKEKTKVIYVEDIFTLNPQLYKSICSVNVEKTMPYRLILTSPEISDYKYNYIMMLKHVLLINSINELNIKGPVGWIDFGISHISKNDTSMFENKIESLDDRLTLFSCENKDVLLTYCGFDAVCKTETLICGCLFYGPSNIVLNFSQNCINAQFSLNDYGFMDDDQITMFIAWKKDVDSCNLITCDWGEIVSKAYNQPSKNSIKKEKKYFIKYYLRKVKRRSIKRNNVNRFRKNLYAFKWPH